MHGPYRRQAAHGGIRAGFSAGQSKLHSAPSATAWLGSRPQNLALFAKRCRVCSGLGTTSPQRLTSVASNRRARMVAKFRRQFAESWRNQVSTRQLGR
jgi:hypothetical protein